MKSMKQRTASTAFHVNAGRNIEDRREDHLTDSSNTNATQEWKKHRGSKQQNTRVMRTTKY
jgi:hypothetical protein